MAPQRILQSVASGLFGRLAFEGGWLMAEMGLFLHFLIAFTCATIFYLAARRIPFLVTHAAWAGLAYGFVIFWFMRLVVLPLSAFPFPIRFPSGPTLLELFFHMTTVGLPIALMTRLALKPSD